VSWKAIGIFDSGVGGLTVLKEIVKSLPQEDTLYLGIPHGFHMGQNPGNGNPLLHQSLHFWLAGTSSCWLPPATPSRRILEALGAFSLLLSALSNRGKTGSVVTGRKVELIGTEGTIRAVPTPKRSKGSTK
jgi:glutamate racemase